MQTHAATLKKVEQQFGVPGRRRGRDLGTRNRLRHQPRQEGSDPLGRDAGVRLPPHRDVPGPTDRRASHRRSRRPHPRRNARRLGRRFRPDPVPAVVLLQVRGRLRRRRPPRPGAQRAGRARLHRQLSQGLRLAAPASAGTKAIRISRRSAAGTRPWSTPRPSRPSPSGSKAAAPAPKSRGADRPNGLSLPTVIAGLKCPAISFSAGRRRGGGARAARQAAAARTPASRSPRSSRRPPSRRSRPTMPAPISDQRLVAEVVRACRTRPIDTRLIAADRPPLAT